MGYDMTFADDLTAEEEAALTKARAAINAAVHPRNVPEPERAAAEKAWEEVWDAYDEATPHYFRLNIWGMREARAAMEQFGMLTDQDHPEWPRPGDFGLTEEDMDDLTDSLDDKEGAATGQEDPLAVARERFRRAQDAVTDAEPQPVTGIPWHKLCSNDGWLVTPAQIGAALAKWETVDEKKRAAAVGENDWFPEWIEWLGKAKERGGFRVY
ncbi:hypothetical protein ACIRPK_23785 [Kitasatospora sp. NPDC101801]|uniref:hypothetical protein n=1 Tax=Kitasatospora sp. NPDC101801 TaxID=3364103 RepID=UPI0037F9DBA9